MNDLNNIASLVLSGAGESLYEIEVAQPQAEPVTVREATKAAAKPNSRKAIAQCCSILGALSLISGSAQAASMGAVPGDLALIGVASILALMVGCAVWLVALIVLQRPRQPKQKTSSAADGSFATLRTI